MFLFSFIFSASKHFSISSHLLSLFLSLALTKNNEAQQTQHREHRQENHFFDGSSGKLSSRRATLRLRFSDTDPLCVVTFKAKAIIVDYVSCIEEDEEPLDPSFGRNYVAEPEKILWSAAESRVLRRAKEEFGALGFLGLGGFGNVRWYLPSESESSRRGRDSNRSSRSDCHERSKSIRHRWQLWTLREVLWRQDGWWRRWRHRFRR